MELSKYTLKGLEIVQNSTLINDETFAQLLDIVYNDILRKKDPNKSNVIFLYV